MTCMYRDAPASQHGMEGDDELLLLLREVLVLEVGPQVVGVPQPAALPAPLQPCSTHPSMTQHTSARNHAKPTPFRCQTPIRPAGGEGSDLPSGEQRSSCRCHGWRCRPAAWRPPPPSTAPSSAPPYRSTAASLSAQSLCPSDPTNAQPVY